MATQYATFSSLPLEIREMCYQNMLSSKLHYSRQYLYHSERPEPAKVPPEYQSAIMLFGFPLRREYPNFINSHINRYSNVVLKVSPRTVTLLSHTLRFPFTANDIARLPFFSDIQGLQIHIHWQPMMTRYATGYRLPHNQTFEEYWQLTQDLLQNIQILCEALTSLTNPPKIRLAFTRYELRTATMCTMPRPALRQAFLKPFEALASTLPQGRIEISCRNAQLEDLMLDGYRWWTPLMRCSLDAPTLRMVLTNEMGEIMTRQRCLWDQAVRSGGTIMLCDLTDGH